MALLRSLAFTLVFYLVTVIAVLAAFPMMLFGERAFRAHVRRWARFYRGAARLILGIRVRVEGTLPGTQALIACKHEAMFETLVLIDLLDGPTPVLKRELADIPLFGRAARVWGVIPVDRAGSATALRAMVSAAKAALARGRSVVIFPEGTRVPAGTQPPLQPGFAGLYRALALPVVPIAVDSGRLWPKGLVKRPGTITLRFGDPIPPGLARAEIEARVHVAINGLN